MGKEELLLALELDEVVEDFREAEAFVESARDHLKAWKAFVHSGTITPQGGGSPHCAISHWKLI